ncbi:MAG TPA: hypothetical protein VF547_00180 [Allosphingosinicella sp.]
MNTRRIAQSYYGIKLLYEFGPEELVHTRTDLSTTHRCSARYENIGVGNPSYLALENRLFTVTALLTAISLAVAALTMIVAYRLQPWLVSIPLGVVPLGFLLVRMRTPFSLHFVLLPVWLDAFGGEAPPIWLRDDDRGQEVLDELVLRWRERLRSLYASVDPDNDAEREAAKFGWLRENGIIEEAEYQAALGEIELLCAQSGSERPLH